MAKQTAKVYKKPTIVFAACTMTVENLIEVDYGIYLDSSVGVINNNILDNFSRAQCLGIGLVRTQVEPFGLHVSYSIKTTEKF
jgi:hypothetical protein